MITNFHISNFKSFGKSISANISDLTIIAGTNSGGKSSIIQTLLLLAQTLENPRSDVALDLGGRFIQFAEFREAVFNRPKNADAEFNIGFECIIPEGDVRDYRTNLLSKTQISTLSPKERILTTPNHHFVEIGFKTKPSGIPFVNFCKYTKTVNGVGTFYYSLQRQSQKYLVTYQFKPHKSLKNIDRRVETIRKKIDLYNSKNEKLVSNSKSLSGMLNRVLDNFPNIALEDLSSFNLRTALKRLDRTQNSFFEEILNEIQALFLQVPISISVTSQVRFDHYIFTPTVALQVELFDSRISERFNDHFRVANQEIRKFLRSIQYIGPLRAKPERAYLSTGTPIEIGNGGENAVPILWVNQNEKIKHKTKIGESPRVLSLSKATKEWIQEFGLSSSFHITKPKRVIYQAEMESNPGSKVMVTIADVGFGVSQLLPVIVAGLWAQIGSTIILEQPEIHLHPKLQGKLADFLICMAELDKNIIVETHSEHLINMVRLRITQDTSNELKKKIGIMFVRPSKSKNVKLKGSTVENLKLDEYGSIINWPSDFFPESDALNENILRAMFKKANKEG